MSSVFSMRNAHNPFSIICFEQDTLSVHKTTSAKSILLFISLVSSFHFVCNIFSYKQLIEFVRLHPTTFRFSARYFKVLC